MERIYLRPETDENGKVRLIDQHGRVLAGVTLMTVKTFTNEPTILNVDIVAKTADGRCIKNRGFNLNTGEKPNT
jgi:hypothetical protein